MKMTFHAREERCDRIYLIKHFIGVGAPIKEIPATTKKFGGRAKAVLTDTGIIVVKDKDVIITMIVHTLKYIKVNFFPNDVIPWEMQRIISRNSQYIPTIEAMEGC